MNEKRLLQQQTGHALIGVHHGLRELRTEVCGFETSLGGCADGAALTEEQLLFQQFLQERAQKQAAEEQEHLRQQQLAEEREAARRAPTPLKSNFLLGDLFERGVRE